MIKVEFQWDPSRRFGNEEPLPATTEIPFVPGIGTEIEHELTGSNWQISRTVWIIAENSEDEHLLIFVV